MPAKKQQRNNFFYFMKEFRRREEAKGVHFNNNSEVAAAAGIEWEKMSPEERRPYDVMVKENKNREKKYTSTGEDVEVVLKREQEEMEAKKTMKTYIENLITNADFAKTVFYAASVNHYCYCNTTRRHIPAEITIIRFSLENGVDLDDIFHVILDTGILPIGYLLVVKKTSEETHLIAPPPHEEELAKISEKNIPKVVYSMMDFLRKSTRSGGQIPPVFVDDSNMELAKDVFDNLLNDNLKDPVKLRVYSLSYLFFVLRNAAHSRISPNQNAFPFPSIPQAELEKDVYDYIKGISCLYHSGNDGFPHCTMSKVIRKIFIICDHSCQDLGIKLIPGRHVPKNASVCRLEQTAPRTSASVTSSRSGSSMSNTSSSLNNESKDPPILRPGRLPNTASLTLDAERARLPKTTSVAMNIEQSASRYNSDFPALGVQNGNAERRPIGRGRGRILGSNFSNN